MRAIGRKAPVAVALACVLLAVGAPTLSASTAIRPAKGTPDPKDMPWPFTSLPYAPPTSQAANLSIFTNVTLPGEVKVAFDNFRVNSGAVSCP